MCIWCRHQCCLWSQFEHTPSLCRPWQPPKTSQVRTHPHPTNPPPMTSSWHNPNNVCYFYHSMLVRRGTDAAREDKNKCEPSFIARRVRAFECRQIISQHLLERTERLSREANNVCSRVLINILEGGGPSWIPLLQDQWKFISWEEKSFSVEHWFQFACRKITFRWRDCTVYTELCYWIARIHCCMWFSLSLSLSV